MKERGRVGFSIAVKTDVVFAEDIENWNEVSNEEELLQVVIAM